jgi:hypothetical protein
MLDHVRAKPRLLQYAIRTEETYVDWIRRFSQALHSQLNESPDATNLS